MNTRTATSGLVTAALLAATVFAAAPVTAGIKSNYAGQQRSLADLGGHRHQAVTADAIQHNVVGVDDVLDRPLAEIHLLVDQSLTRFFAGLFTFLQGKFDGRQVGDEMLQQHSCSGVGADGDVIEFVAQQLCLPNAGTQMLRFEPHLVPQVRFKLNIGER